ncbi:MAG TPA: hypothetical protein VFX11_14075, partial [Candidatus Kapabacteria bacterium]|nr:hypothetical protein [Candidatus Kapabacteria bacterium]
SQVLYRPGWTKPAHNNKNLSPSFVIPVRQIMAMFHLGHCHCIRPYVAVLFCLYEPDCGSGFVRPPCLREHDGRAFKGIYEVASA